MSPIRVLVLGGTTEARRLAAELDTTGGVHVISSLAGRTGTPLPIDGEVRIGGFGGADGLAGWLRTQRVDAVVDATHPFAEAITTSAARATTAADVPLLALRRPGWQPQRGDDWRVVASMADAAAALPRLGWRVFLTIGRQQLDAFAGLADRWFLIRSVEPPQPPLPARHKVVLDRGPFPLDGERELLRRHRIDVVVSKDSGGAAAKLTAARELGIPVVLVRRPDPPGTAETVSTVPEAVAWVRSIP